MSGVDDLIEPFLVEARDLIARARGDLARLVEGPGDRAALDGAFRSVHTLKGATGLVDLPALNGLLHVAEAHLVRAREARVLDGARSVELTQVLDATEAWVDAIEARREPGPPLRQTVEGLTRQLRVDEAPAPPRPVSADDAWARALAADADGSVALVALRYTPSPEAYFRGEDPLAILRAVPGLVRLDVSAPPARDPLTYDPFRCELQFLALSEASPDEVRAATRLVSDEVEMAIVEPAGGAGSAAAGLRLRSLHVDAGRLDALAALVDELVIARNALAHETRQLAALAGTGRGGALAAREAALERLVGGLHTAVTDLRLTPLDQLFGRFPRQVREIAGALGKSAELRTSGGDVALDKSVVEGLFEPVLHLLRNAVDHGVEDPAARRAAGKPDCAAITLSAAARGAEVLVEIADDGRGVDVAAARRRAVARGLVTPEAAEALTDDAAAELVFAPGLSTAAEVSALSGRGVGMDAVRSAVHRLGGQVSLANAPGRGLTVRLVLPAQVLLTKILVVTAGAERFGVPLDMIRETHRVRRDEVTTIRDSRAYVRRDTVIPILRLGDIVGGAAGDDAAVFPVLNVLADGERIGVQVDGIGERLDAPMRPMEGLLAGQPGALGTVLQGDGSVLLVLDLAELAA